MESRKMVLINSCRAAVDADIQNRRVGTVGEGEGETNWESSIETYITICKIDIQWKFTVWRSELNLVLCNNPEEWDEVGGGRGHMYTYGCFTLWYSRNQCNIVKQLSSNLK